MRSRDIWMKLGIIVSISIVGLWVLFGLFHETSRSYAAYNTTASQRVTEQQETITRTLPFAWIKNNNAVSSENRDLINIMPPFRKLSSNGVFMLGWNPDRESLAITFNQNASASQNIIGSPALNIGWQLSEEPHSLDLPLGKLVTFEVRSRTFSQPDGVIVYVEDVVDGQVERSQVIILGEEERTYTVSRRVRVGAEDVRIGFDWTLPFNEAWLDLASIRAVIQGLGNTPTALDEYDEPFEAKIFLPVISR